MINSFDTDIALDVGVNAAIIYKNIQFWCEKNRANGMNEHEGHFWTYNSIKAFCTLFPYMSEKQIRSSLKVLENKGYILSGNFNKSSYDRTKWYADLKEEMSDSICPTSQMDFVEKANEFDPEGEPIPDINTYIKPNKGIYISDKAKKKTSSMPPKLEEIEDYCFERQNDVDPQHFYDYYTSNGWKVGKNPMKDWKAAIRTWERNSNGKPINSSQGHKKSTGNEFLDLLNKWEDEDE